MASLEDRLSTLEATVASQRAALDAQHAEIAVLRDRLARNEPLDDPVDEIDDTPTAIVAVEVPKRSSRRMSLKGGAVAAGAAIAGATVGPRSAAATDGAALLVGGNNTSAGGNTRLNGTGAGQYVDQNIFTVSDQNFSSSFPSAIGAYGEGDRVNNGVYAFVGSRSNTDTNTDTRSSPGTAEAVRTCCSFPPRAIPLRLLCACTR